MEAVGSLKPVHESIKWVEVRQNLKSWREEGARNSLRTVEGGNVLLRRRKSDLGNEVWSIYEQTCVAALDCGDLALAEECLESLVQQLPSSLRVTRLRGLFLEAQEKYAEAETLYSDVLEAHPSCSAVWKRKVAVLKAQGKTSDAIEQLNKFLQVYMSDFDAWLELADLYIAINEYRRACFCLEELILSNPHHYLYHIKYAEICYTIGSQEKVELARKHYATAVKLNPSDMRALFGFYMVLQWLSGRSKQGETRSKTNYQSLEWVKRQIKKNYQFDDSKLRIVEKMLDKN